MKYGVDISEYDNKIDYDVFKQQIDFAIIRIGYGIQNRGDQIDKLLDEHYNNLKYDIPLGAYYYAYGTNYEQGRQEAENCLDYIGKKTFELPIFYDLEEERNTMEGARGFVDRIREEGLKAGIYCSTSFYKRKFAGIDCDCLWLAEYGSNNGEIPSSEPRYIYDIWQYSSLGTYDGWNRRGDVDLAKDYVLDEITPTPQPQPEPTPGRRLIYNGCSGDDVQYLQNKLIEKGYSLPKYGADSFFGDETESAVRQLQSDAGIDVDGMCGDNTWEVIESDFSKPIKPEYPGYLIYLGRTGEDVRMIQQRLIELGYSCGYYGADSIFGNSTKQAIIAFQRDNGLGIDGIVGLETWNALF